MGLEGVGFFLLDSVSMMSQLVTLIAPAPVQTGDLTILMCQVQCAFLLQNSCKSAPEEIHRLDRIREGYKVSG